MLKPGLLLFSTFFLASLAAAQVDFSVTSVTQVSTPAQLRAGAGVGTTAFVNGVAAQPSPTGDVYAIHVDSAQQEAFLRVNPATGAATKITDVPAMASQLGGDYMPIMTLVGGFAYSAANNKLFFAENYNGDLDEVSVISIDATSGNATLVTRSTAIDGLNDFGALPDGNLAGVLGEDGPREVGIINTTSGAWTPKINEDDLIAAAPGSGELPPESIGVSAGTGEAYVFCHDDLELFQVPDLTSATPALNRLTQPELGDVDLHDVVMDETGNMFGFDEGGEQIVVLRKADGVVFSISFDDIHTALGGSGSFSPSLWRGLAARSVDGSQVDLFMSSFTSDYGIVRVRFGTAGSSISDWNVY